MPELVVLSEATGIAAGQSKLLSNLLKLGKASVIGGIVFFCLMLQGSEVSSPVASNVLSPSECKELVAKMQREIDGIMSKDRGNKASEQYALVATRDGIYPDVRNGTVYMKKGDVWKYGQTHIPKERYTQGYLLSIGVKKVTEFIGLPEEVLIVEKLKLYGYYMEHGHLPQEIKFLDRARSYNESNNNLSNVPPVFF
ncbi:MAG: hypothetical protein IJU95_06005 [Treponema sp.]|nr:hypothetical protein [Treponema sp.]